MCARVTETQVPTVRPNENLCIFTGLSEGCDDSIFHVQELHQNLISDHIYKKTKDKNK